MAERKSFLLRIDSALWEELEAWAQDELRSVNGQIEYLLRQAIIKRTGNSPRRELRNTKVPEPKRGSGGSRGRV